MELDKKKPIKFNPEKVRFTKVLTKYSTEYNNMLFIKNLCQQLSMDKKDVFSYFLHLRDKYTIDEIYEIFDMQSSQSLITSIRKLEFKLKRFRRARSEARVLSPEALNLTDNLLSHSNLSKAEDKLRQSI